MSKFVFPTIILRERERERERELMKKRACRQPGGGGSFRMSLIWRSASNPNLIFIVTRTHDNQG